MAVYISPIASITPQICSEQATRQPTTTTISERPKMRTINNGQELPAHQGKPTLAIWDVVVHVWRVVIARIHGTRENLAPIAPDVRAYEPRVARASVVRIKPGNFRRDLASDSLRALWPAILWEGVATDNVLTQADRKSTRLNSSHLVIS